MSAGLLPAQFLNRATWLGVEREGIRSDFRRGVEYFMDRASYVVLPPWWNRGLPRFHDQLSYRGGSVRTAELTLEGQLDVTKRLGSGWSAGFHMLQSETRDTRFLRTALELEYELGPGTAVFAQAELFAEKAVVDASVGAWLLRNEHEALRVMLTAVDAPSAKNADLEYQTDAYALMVAGAFGDPESHRVAFEVSGQLPFEVHDVPGAAAYELQRWIGSVESHVRLGERSWLVGAAEVEWTDKSRAPLTGGTVEPEDFRRDFREFRVEYWHDDPETPWSLGVSHLVLEEDGITQNLDNRLRGRREEWFGIARIHLPFSGRLSFEPQVLAGNVRRIARDAMNDEFADRFEGKLAFNTLWDFSEHARMTVQVTTQLDEAAFGGGGVQFVARF